MEGGSEFQIDDPENTRLILKFFELYILVDLTKSERMYSGVSPLDTINIITVLLYFSCFVNGRSLRVFSLSSVGLNKSERMSLATRQRREFIYLFYRLHCNHLTQWRLSLCEII